MLALRDARRNRFSDFLLRVVETSLCNGQVYFNFYPNFEVFLTDKHLLDVLTLNIKTKGYDMKMGVENVVLIYSLF